LKHGLAGLRARVAERRRQPATADQQAWLEAAAVSLEGLSDWAKRYAEFDRSIPDVSSAPPSSFREALQLMWLAHQAIHIEGHGYSCTPDHIDQLLLPYYEADRKAGRITDAEVLSLAENFTLKMYDNTFWGPKHHLTQGLCLGGSDGNGKDLTNRLSWLFLEAATNLALPEPLVWIRWHKNIDQEFFDFALSRIARSTCFPLMWNDEAIVPALEKLGVSTADARNYIAVGCNELAIPGQFYFNPNANANYIGSILKTVKGPAPATFEAFVETTGGHVRESIAKSYAQEMKVLAATMKWGQTPLTSCFFDGQIERAQDLVAGTKYNLLTCGGIFFANAVDCLAAIREVVYDSRQATLGQVAAACEANFKGHEKLRALLLAAPKHGNDDPRLDDIIRTVERMRDVPMKEICRDPRDGSPFGNGHVVRSSAVRGGRVTPATPDGRLAGTPMASSIAASAGMEKSGPTALLNSVAKLNGPESWQHGYQVNLRFQAMMLKDKARRDKVRALVNVYFAKGGQELQINAIDTEMLRAAQASPEQYKDLVVRIAGFSEFFVNLTRDMQDEIIARTAHM
jgi:formate C-acetyltransferase